MNKKEYEEGLKRLEILMDLNPKLESEEGKELDSLASLLVEYEDIHYPISEPIVS